MLTNELSTSRKSSMKKYSSVIEDHSVFKNDFFEVWSKQPPRTGLAAALLFQIQAFCAATRKDGQLVKALQGIDKAASESVSVIIASEQGHGIALSVMCGFILSCTPGNQGTIPDQVKEIDKFLREKSIEELGVELLSETRELIKLFEPIKHTNRSEIMSALGVRLAVEILANRQIIPGELQAFIDSKKYVLKGKPIELTSPKMNYLREHAGEYGAEQEHEKKMFSVLLAAVEETDLPVVVNGSIQMCDALEKLYNKMKAHLVER